jgi:CHAT domain-containing protein
MGRTFSRRWSLAPLLFLLLGSGTAAVPSAESLYREAQAAFARGDYKKAAPLASLALAQLGNRDDELTWRVRILDADALTGQGLYKEAQAVLRRPLPSRLAGSDIEVLRLRGLAVVAYRLKQRENGDLLIRRAHRLAKKVPSTLASVLIVLANYDEPNKETWGREALKYARAYKDVQTELRVRGTIGLALANQERFDEAIGMWEPSLVQARAVGNASLEEKFEGNLGWAYLELGDYETADARFTHALTTAKLINARKDAVPWMYQLGNIRLQRGDVAGAEEQYRGSYKLAVELKDDQQPIVLAYLANAALKAGRLADARRYTDQSLQERRNDPDGMLRSQLLDGRVATAEGRWADAERLLNDVLARTRSPQTRWETRGRLAQLYVKTGAFSAADREFARMLATAREARANVREMELRFAFFNALSEVFDSYVDFLVARGRFADALAVTEASRAQTLEEAMPSTVQPRDVRGIAQETGATILCYWLGSEHSYLWVVTPEQVGLVTLPPKHTIETAVEAYQRDLFSPRGSLSMSGERGTALWRMLVKPAAGTIAPGSRVIIVPDGSLHAFNMETLVVPSPKPHYWIEDAVIATAGSLKLLARRVSRPETPPRLLLVGNAPPPSGEFAPLPRAGIEMDKVASHFDGARSSIFSGAKATPSSYRSASPADFTFLHFVAHGVATREKPLDSAIVLAREGESFKLYARDIAKEPLTAQLVTISSCHGAGTRTYAGEGLVGLAWAFLRAGAGNVIAALWKVDDSATPGLMDQLYGGIRAGRDPAVALRDAKLALVRGQNAHKRPLYWAPFVLYTGS